MRTTYLLPMVMMVGCAYIRVGDELGEVALVDVNPNSPSYDQVVTANEFQGSVSLWYFGHAT